jgi:replicative DNA helicase
MLYKANFEHWREARKICARARELGDPEFATDIGFIDGVTGGFKRGHIWIVAGKTSSGKTSLALQLARSFADNPQHTILFLSLEQRGWELSLRMFSEIEGISYFDLINGKMEIPEDQSKKFEDYLSKIDFEILEGGYKFDDVVKTIETYYKTKKPDVIFLDFIQLIEWKDYNDERIAIMEYIRKIKEMANTYDVGFVIVSQIRRLPSGADYNREPDLSDLKGSGSLEQCADVVLLISKETTVDRNGNIINYFINIAKNRQGMTAKKQVIFEGQYYRFKDFVYEGVEKKIVEMFEPTATRT